MAEESSRPAEALDVAPGGPFGLEEPGPERIDERLALGGRTIREHAARGAAINAAFNIGLTALGLVQRVVVAAFLTVSEFGLWGLLISTMITLIYLKQVGISEKYVQQSEPDQKLAFQKAFTLELAYSAMFWVVILVALPVYALIYGRPEIIGPGVILSVAVPLSAFSSPIWVAYRQMRFVRQRVLEAVQPVVMTVVAISLAVAGAGYWSFVAAGVLGTASGAIVAVLTSPYPLAIRFDRDALREYVGFSWPLFVSSASSLAIVQGAVIVGNYTVGLAGVGALALAATFLNYVDGVDDILKRTMYPAVCAVADRRDLLYEAFTKSNHLALMWGIPFGVALALFAPDLVEFVLGEKWRLAEGLLQVLGIIVALHQVAFNWNIFINAVGDTRPMAVNAVVTVLVFFVITVPLMFAIGLDGYAIGMLAVVAAEIAVRFYYLARLFDSRRVLHHALRAVLPALPAIAVVLAVRQLESGDRTLEIALAELAVYVALVAGATYALERPLLREMLGYLRSSPGPAPAG